MKNKNLLLKINNVTAFISILSITTFLLISSFVITLSIISELQYKNDQNPALYSYLTDLSASWSLLSSLSLSSSSSSFFSLPSAFGQTPIPEQIVDGTESPVTTEQGNQFDPSISSDNVVYTGTQAGDSNVYYYNIQSATTHPVIIAPGDQQLSSISGQLIAYTDFASGNADIYLYNISNGMRSLLSTNQFDQINPSLSDKIVAWEDFRGSDPNIWLYNLKTHQDIGSISGIGQQHSPSVSGYKVAYGDDSDGSIKVYDTNTGITTTVFNGPITGSGSRPVDIDGSNVVYTKLVGSVDSDDIEVYNLDTQERKTLALDGLQVSPHISGEWIVFDDFKDQQTHGPHTGLWHWTTNELFYPAPQNSKQILSNIDNNRIVYTDNRNNNNTQNPSENLDIFMFEFNTANQVDIIPPNTTIVSITDGSGNILENNEGTSTTTTVSSNITFEFTGEDNISQPSELEFNCSIDHLTIAPCTSPITLNNLEVGQHIFEVFAIDTSGNADQTPSQFTWTIITLAQGIDKIITTIDSFNLPNSVSNSLKGPLHQASEHLNDNNSHNDISACNKLDSFSSKLLNYIENGQLTQRQGEILAEQAVAIMTEIGCFTS